VASVITLPLIVAKIILANIARIGKKKAAVHRADATRLRMQCDFFITVAAGFECIGQMQQPDA